MKTIKAKIQVYFFISALIPFIIFGISNVIMTSNRTKSDLNIKLKTISDIKQKILNDHLKNIGLNMKMLSENKLVIDYLEAYANKNSNDVLKEKQAPAFNIIQNYQENFWGVVHHVFLINTDGKVILSPPHGNSKASHIDQDISDSKYLSSALKNPTVTDFFGFSEKTHFHQLYMQPVFSSNGETTGVIVNEIIIAYQNKLLKENFSLGKTGKIYLTTLDGIKIVNDAKDLTDPIKRKGLSEVISKESIMLEESDLSTPVIAMYTYDNQFPWILVIEIEKSEVMKPVKGLIGVTIVVILILAIIIGVVGFFVGKTIASSLSIGVNIAERIATGDFTQEIDANQEGEIGQLMKSLSSMSQNLQKMFANVTQGVITLTSSSSELSSAANQIISNSNETSEKSNKVTIAFEEMNDSMSGVATTTEEATNNIQMIVSATEEMSITIQEISNNTSKGSKITQNAVDNAKQLSGKVDELDKVAKEITKVTDTIADISKQTNLLALNATIEAARAGEAGKGFAVVANEIKELAKQTEDATNEINSKVSGIQATTTDSVKSIDEIVSIIIEVNEIVATVATAIEEQNHTTQEISSNIGQAASGIGEVNDRINRMSTVTREVKQNVAEVNKAAEETNTGSIQVNNNAGTLSSLAKQLKDIVDQFKI